MADLILGNEPICEKCRQPLWLHKWPKVECQPKPLNITSPDTIDDRMKPRGPARLPNGKAAD
jgi:hypothetical protein